MELVAFGRPAKKLVGATIAKLIALQTINRMKLPRPLKSLIKQARIFTKGLTTRTIKTRITNYKMFDYDDLQS
ncbi:hypothetical protein POUND7_003319 [Theobroma cacao]